MKFECVFKKITAFALTIILLLPLSVNSFAVSGETSRTVENIILSDGTDTGVTFTQIQMSGYYGDGKVASFAECDLSNTHLSIEVLNCGSNTVGLQKMPDAIKSFNKSGRTVLAAINGDLWMTGVSSTSSITKSVLRATRGALVIDREIWATQEIPNECGIPAGKLAFGVTSQNQPLVGIMDIAVSMTNTTKNVTVEADGINRLPGDNSIILYNSRLNSTNYALNDSYEIELSCENAAFRFDTPLSATVKAIYPSGSTTRPAINKGTVVITARGTRISDVSSSFAIGDTVVFNSSVSDRFGNTKLWNDVVDAIGGHMMPLRGGEEQAFDNSKNEYPTTLIGVKPDGKVMFCTVSYNKSGVYKGLRFYQAARFCREMGYSDVFYLDGGGSSTMVTLKEGTYTVRNCTSDGSVRAVINGVAMVWNDESVCERQGDLGYLVESPMIFDNENISTDLIYSTHNLTSSYDSGERALKLTVTAETNPCIRFDVSKFNIKANQFGVAVIIYKIPLAGKFRTEKMSVKTTNPLSKEGDTTSVNFADPVDGSIWQASVLALSSEYLNEDGTIIDRIRIDPFERAEAGAEFYIDSICFCRSVTSAVDLANKRLLERNGASPDSTQLLLVGTLPIASKAYEDMGTVKDYDYNNFSVSFDMGFYEEGGAGCYYLCDGEKYIYISQDTIALGDTASLLKGKPTLSCLSSISWGEISALNFHRFTIRVRNGDAKIFMDGVEKASILGRALYGNGAVSSNAAQKLSSCTTVNVMFDNFVFYDGNYKKLLSVSDFYPKWTATLNTLRYSMNGGVGYVPQNIFVTGNPVTIPNYTPRNSNCIFKGWSEDPNATRAQYKAGDRITKTTPTTLYAVWETPHVHSWNEGTVTISPDCIHSGVKVFACTGCGQTKETQLAPLGHDYGDFKTTIEQTCTSEGMATRTCTSCGKEESVSLERLPHDYSICDVIAKPTYTLGGVNRYTCAMCGAHYDIPTPKIDIIYGDLDGDMQVTALDIKNMIKYMVGILSKNDIILKNADIDCDGEITARDLKEIRIIIVTN